MRESLNKSTLLEREKALKKYNLQAKTLPQAITVQNALASIFTLYDLIPAENRRRPINPQGVKTMHLTIARYKSK